MLVTVLIAVVALYSNAWSLGGRGLEVNVWVVLIFIGILGIGAVVAVFSTVAINIGLTVLCFILGIIGVGICTNEAIFLFRSRFLSKKLFLVGSFEFRLMELVSLLVGLAFTLGWYFSHNNIFLNDILSICICIGLIKILKFTNLQTAGLAFLVTIILELTVIVVIYIVGHQSYNNLFLN